MASTELIAMAVAGFGGMVLGLTGFGFGLVVVPLLLLIYPPATVTAVVVSTSLTTGWVVLLGAWRSAQLRTVLALAPGATIGAVLGILSIQTLEPAVIKLIAGAAVVIFALSVLRGWKVRAAHSPLAAPLAGVASGALNTTTGLSSPPVVLLFNTRDYDMQAFRSSITIYFYYINVIGMSLLVQQGIVGRTQLPVVLRLLPAAIAGGLMGRQLVGRFSQQQFRRLTIVMLLVTGTIGVVTSLRSLLG